jgi:ATP-dependent HslUV protease subunit HslV
MTTIAYRNGIMAADSAAWIGDACVSPVRKLAKGKSGTLYGVCGCAAEAENFLRWVEDGESGEWPRGVPETECRSSMIVLVAPTSGAIMLYTARGIETYDMPYFALGSGNVGALCAMHAGASAESALRACIAHANGASGDVQVITNR